MNSNKNDELVSSLVLIVPAIMAVKLKKKEEKTTGIGWINILAGECNTSLSFSIIARPDFLLPNS